MARLAKSPLFPCAWTATSCSVHVRLVAPRPLTTAPNNMMLLEDSSRKARSTCPWPFTTAAATAGKSDWPPPLNDKKPVNAELATSPGTNVKCCPKSELTSRLTAPPESRYVRNTLPNSSAATCGWAPLIAAVGNADSPTPLPRAMTLEDQVWPPLVLNETFRPAAFCVMETATRSFWLTCSGGMAVGAIGVVATPPLTAAETTADAGLS